MTGNVALQSTLDAYLTFESDYDNGTIKLYLKPNNPNKITGYKGTFLISRTSVLEKFKIWTPIIKIGLTNTLPTGPIYVDYTV